jgi:hypothetical protein
MQISSTLSRRWSVLALAAVLGLAVTFAATSASNASSGDAVAAKKKCKKKHKSAASAKKKKCKKKKAVVPPVTTPTPPSNPTPSVPTTRASVTWDSDSEVDLHVYDALGNHAFYDGNDIPDSEENDQSTDGGPETFIDHLSPSSRTFTFYVCLYSYGDTPTSGDIHVTSDITDPDGGHRSIEDTLTVVDDEELVTVSPSSEPAYAPLSGFCHAPV